MNWAIKNPLRWLATLTVALLMSGCATFVSEQQIVSNEPESALGNVEYHTAELAQELFSGLSASQQYRYAVVGFVEVTSLKFNPKIQHPLMLLGHQLEQGLMTEANRRGLITQDFKVTDSIMLGDMSESVMSRDSSKLTGSINADFYISGTIIEQQEGAIVNARVVHVKSKDVIAAATKFFPAELFWQREQVTSRNGMIYRTGSD